MKIEEVKKEFEKGGSEIILKVPISEHGTFDIWGAITIRKFDGQPLSWEDCCSNQTQIRMHSFASGSALPHPYPKIYRIDNCNKEFGLHEHLPGSNHISINPKTVGDALQIFFDKSNNESLGSVV